MRVSQSMLFDHYVTNMNTSLSSLLELNLKAQTQKVINRPSDDPTGMERVLSHRDSIRQLEQYQENLNTAKGWLGRADSTLLQLDTLIIRTKELATQAATGTYDANNRQQISYEVRSLFEQMVEMANMEYEDKSIFAGHKTDTNAFEQALWMTTNDQDLTNSNSFRIEGDSDKTVLVQFYDTSGAAQPGDAVTFNSGNVGVRYTTDGGTTWKTDGTVSGIGATGEVTVNLVSAGAAIVFEGVTATTSIKANSTTDMDDESGTWAWLRPTAIYKGDDKDAVSVDFYGQSNISATAAGSFNKHNVVVRVDNTTAVTMAEKINYSYSLDGGITWTTGNTTTPDATSNGAILTIPTGGTLTLSSNGGNTLNPGAQFVIRPRTSDIEIDISVDEQVRLNNVGKDIFGGLWQNPDSVLAGKGARVGMSSSNTSVAFESGNKAMTYFGSNAAYSKNLFETMGNLIGFLETNNQEGVQRALENLNRSQRQVLNAAADVGGREHRVEVAISLVDTLKLNEKERLSGVEDADVSELMTQITQQQIVYESVLRSTSLIMNLNLMKYI
ncbi:MAG: flagellar hook-associated protein FlgL [Proteobacteria bacterium]|nr:flagellar hook-associated protein FlgL [Pseudomonadota bacterium]MBU1612413.1 flagellar hook-associated protein FlgL [Pseudomonadota bacterium]